MPDAILCYIRENRAYFTTCPLDKQWGDDWDDAPYEHNAGDPYDWREGYSKEEPYKIVHLYFEGPYQTPAEQAWNGNSQWSVEAINTGAIAWLIPEYAPKEAKPIFAATTLPEFKRMIKEAGGAIYELEP